MGQFLRSLVILCLLCIPFAGRAKNLFDTTIRPADSRPELYLPLLKDRKVALVINQTSVINKQSLLDMLINRHINVVKIFVPEHGFRGTEDAGAKVDNTTDSATGLPVISLYGSHKKPTPEDLAGIDVMVYDLQDVGARFYTYISTLEYCMEACGASHISFVVLDRPNPNGFYVDGPVLEKENKSFVGMQPVPIVYGMTAGEYAKMLAGEKWIENAADLQLHVIRCKNYTHASRYQLPVAPSPNLRTMAAVYAYPALCLFEGTVVSVGRGTSQPFCQYGNPEFSGKYGYSFTPVSGPGAQSPPYENKPCYGEMIGTDAEVVLRKMNHHLPLDWLKGAYQSYPDKDKFFNSFFVKLCGGWQLEQQVQKGETEAAIRNSWQPGLVRFKEIRKKYLLYEDFE